MRCWCVAATPEVGSRWSDDGDVRESRCLKGRAEGETRVVPLHPELVEILRDLIDGECLARGDLLFAGERGGPLAGSVYRPGVWQSRLCSGAVQIGVHSSGGRGWPTWVIPLDRVGEQRGPAGHVADWGYPVRRCRGVPRGFGRASVLPG